MESQKTPLQTKQEDEDAEGMWRNLNAHISKSLSLGFVLEQGLNRKRLVQELEFLIVAGAPREVLGTFLFNVEDARGNSDMLKPLFYCTLETVKEDAWGDNPGAWDTYCFRDKIWGGEELAKKRRNMKHRGLCFMWKVRFWYWHRLPKHLKHPLVVAVAAVLVAAFLAYYLG